MNLSTTHGDDAAFLSYLNAIGGAVLGVTASLHFDSKMSFFLCWVKSLYISV